MKLSELVAYRDKLRKHDINTFNSMNTQIFDLLQAEIEDPEYLNLFTEHRNKIMRDIDKFKADHLDYDHKLTEQIHEQEKSYLVDSEERFKLYFDKETVQSKRERTLDISKDTLDYLKVRIERYINWDQPGLQICPSHGNLTEELVSLDPLYLIDFSDILIKPIREKFSEKYRTRLRSYSFPKSNSNQPMFDRLPQEQFGFILAYNFFDNMSINYLQKMLKECFELLKPGGKMLFTFNDCDLPHNIDLVERNWKYYTPGRLVRHYIENTGFTVLKHFSESYGMAWFEIEKPGKLESIKGGQVLASIHQKNLIKLAPPWSPNNEGYMRGEQVSYKEHNYEARRNLGVHRTWDNSQWKLVE